MSSVLTIAGSTIARATSRIILERLTLSLDRPDELEFTELAADLPGSYHPEQAVTLSIDGTASFSGWIFGRHPGGFGEGSGRVGYRCLGLSYGADLIAVTASDGSGTMSFNLPVTDPNYAPTEAGLSVGTILSQVLAQHSSQLTSIGVSTDATTAGQLAALTVVPPDPVYVSGNALWTQSQQLLMQWYGSRYALYITAAGLVRCYDTTALTTKTVTLDSDPAILASIAEDTSECYTRVVLRGRDWVEPAYLSLHDGTMSAAWSAPDQAAWTINDFLYPKNGYSQGTITALTSTVATVQSDSATETWGVNYWSGVQGQIALINPLVTGLAGYQEYRHITANGALSAGGTSAITLDSPLGHSGYTRYQIRGTPAGKALVWRKYNITNTYIAQHLVEQFNAGVRWGTSSAVTLTQTPAAVVCYNNAGLPYQFPWQVVVVPYDGTNDGYILFIGPVVQVTSTQAQLQSGGASVVAPTDVQVVVPYSRGTLTVQSPAGGGYSGTANSLFGVQRTLYRDYPSWIDAGNSSNMQALADNILATTDNAVQEGSLTYFDKYTDALPSGSWPIRLDLAKATGTTGYESMAAPCRTVTLEWPQEGPTSWRTHLSFSTRRQMYSGDRLYVHPTYLGGTSGPSEAIGGGGPRFAGTAGFGARGPADGDISPYGGMADDSRRPDHARPSERHREAVEGKRARDAAADRGDERRRAATNAAEREREERIGKPTRLGPAADRERAAEQHDAGDRERRESAGAVVEADNKARAERLRAPERPFDDALAMRPPAPEQERSSPAAGDAMEGGG